MLLLLWLALAQSPQQQTDAVATLAAVGQHARADVAVVNAGALYVGGWGFECSSASAGTITLRIDGQDRPDALVYRSERGDVWQWAWSNGICATAPWMSGVNALVDVAALAPGLHTAELVIRNAAGVEKRSNSQAFTK